MIKGTVFDATTGETLPQANVYFSDASGSPGSATNGTATDVNGQFSFSTTPAGNSYLTASYTGYSPQTLLISGNTDFHLSPATTNLPEVEIFGSKDTSQADSSVKYITPSSSVMVYTVGGILAAVFTLYIVLKKRK